MKLKKGIANILQITLAVAVLFISSGVAINKMECLKSGKVIYSVKEIPNCNTEDNCSFSEKCCDFYTVVFDYKITALHSIMSVDLTQPSGFLIFDVKLNLMKKQVDSFLFSSDLPPPFKQCLLIIIQVFRL